MKKVHYPNLNSLRFLAAFVVIIHHTEQIKSIKGLPNLWDNNTIIPLIGKLGVDLFFVLSGFLITSLLFIEKASPTGINVKNFIVRRLLRIWPLYFIIMILAFFVMPHIPLFQLGLPYVDVKNHMLDNALMYVFFLPHVQLIVFGPILYASQSWSIGIEEQFYLVWSSVVKRFDTKKLVQVTLGFIFLYLGICVVLKYLVYSNFHSGPISLNAIKVLATFFIYLMKFDCLLIGVLFAVLNKNLKANSIFVKNWFQWLVYLAEILLVCTGLELGGFFWEIHAVLYGFIILNLVRAETSIFNIEYRILNYLGKISYGMYMYHILIVNIVVTVLYKYNLQVLVYPVIYALVVLVSSLSYKYLEGYFLKMKKSYSVIATG